MANRIRECSIGEAVTDHVHQEHTVKANCASTTNGAYLCVTHGQAYRRNFDWAEHLRRGEHAIAWYCFDHGPEPMGNPDASDAEVLAAANKALRS